MMLQTHRGVCCSAHAPPPHSRCTHLEALAPLEPRRRRRGRDLRLLLSLLNGRRSGRRVILLHQQHGAAHPGGLSHRHGTCHARAGGIYLSALQSGTALPGGRPQARLPHFRRRGREEGEHAPAMATVRCGAWKVGLNTSPVAMAHKASIFSSADFVDNLAVSLLGLRIGVTGGAICLCWRAGSVVQGGGRAGGTRGAYVWRAGGRAAG